MSITTTRPQRSWLQNKSERILHKQPNKIITNNRIKSPQITEKASKDLYNSIIISIFAAKLSNNRKMGNMYKPRLADRLLVRKLAGKGAVLIEGPKWCGKTTTARQQAKSLLDLGDTEVLKQSRQMMEISSKTGHTH
jgi:hypothetical protein